MSKQVFIFLLSGILVGGPVLSAPMKKETIVVKAMAKAKELKAEQSLLLEDLALSERKLRNYSHNLEILSSKSKKDSRWEKDTATLSDMLKSESSRLEKLKSRNLAIESELAKISVK